MRHRTQFPKSLGTRAMARRHGFANAAAANRKAAEIINALRAQKEAAVEATKEQQNENV